MTVFTKQSDDAAQHPNYGEHCQQGLAKFASIGLALMPIKLVLDTYTLLWAWNWYLHPLGVPLLIFQQALVIPCISQVIMPTSRLSASKLPLTSLLDLTFTSVFMSAARLAFVFSVHQYLP